MIFSAATAATLSKTIKVLIIEDSLGYARFVYELLKIDDPYGFEIFHNVKLESGLDRLSKNDIDIVLLDLGLPDSNGLDTLIKLLNSVNNQIPVVIFSNRNDEDYIQEAIKLGAQDYLCKGEFDSRLLRHTLKAAIERKRLITRLEIQAQEIKKRNLFFELNERRFSKTLDNLPGLFLIYDENKQVRYMNTAASELFGNSSAAVIMKDRNSLRSDENQSFLHNLNKCISLREGISSKLCFTINGRKYSGTFNFMPVLDADEKTFEVIVNSYNFSPA